jgi:hypothetical protein
MNPTTPLRRIQIPVTKLQTVTPLRLLVRAKVRYWEDAAVNGIEDIDGSLIPCRQGDIWKPCIDLTNGKIIDWPEGTTADIHYKVCDGGKYFIQTDGPELKWKGSYVPDSFLCHGDKGHGDYIILNVDEQGYIKDWKEPTVDPNEWEVIQ